MTTVDSIAKRWYRLAIVAGLASACAYLYRFSPDPTNTPPCPTRFVFGIECPGCGSLRAIHHALHGRFARSLALNPLTITLGPLALLAILFPEPFRRWIARHPRLYQVNCLLVLSLILASWLSKLISL